MESTKKEGTKVKVSTDCLCDAIHDTNCPNRPVVIHYPHAGPCPYGKSTTGENQ